MRRTVKETTKRKLRVAAYCRVSTLQDCQDTSYETQCAVYTQQITENPDYELVGIYGDHGKSGRNMNKRPELQRLLADCEAGKIDLILTKSVSRFSRNMQEFVKTVQHLKELGVNIFFERERLSSNDAKYELLMNILVSIAQEESHSIGQNQKWAYDRRCQAGTPTKMGITYGYERKGYWVVNEQQAKIVREAFAMADRGCQYREIIKRLDQMEEETQSDNRWNLTKLTYMLKHVVYKGDFLSNRFFSASGGRCKRNKGEFDQYYIEQHHQAIVSVSQFDRVQMIMQEGLLRQIPRIAQEERGKRIDEIHEMMPDAREGECCNE